MHGSRQYSLHGQATKRTTRPVLTLLAGIGIILPFLIKVPSLYHLPALLAGALPGVAALEPWHLPVEPAIPSLPHPDLSEDVLEVITGYMNDQAYVTVYSDGPVATQVLSQRGFQGL